MEPLEAFMRRIPCEKCAIRDTGIIADLPDDRLEDFYECGSAAIYKARQLVFHEGTPATGLFILCYGAVRLYQSDRFGREYLLGVAGPGDVLGEMPLDPSELYSVSAEVLTESQLCYLPRDKLIQFIQIHPLVGVRLISALSKALSTARKKVRDIALKPAETRLAELLVQLSQRPDGAPRDPETRITLGYSRREIAELIGVTTETAIRLLGRLKQHGVLTIHGREIVVTDLDKLTRLATRLDI